MVHKILLLVLPKTYEFFSFIFSKIHLFWEREHEHKQGGGAEGEGERVSSRFLTNHRPHVGLKFTTLTS